MSIEIPGLDVQKGLDLYDGEEEFYIFALKSWVTNTPESLDKLANVSKETLADYAITIHGVKGTSAHIGAEALREKAKNMEAQAKSGDLDGILAVNDSFIKEASALLAVVKDWLDKNAKE